MNKLQKIIAPAALAGSMFLGYITNTNAQVAPTKVATETSIIESKDNSGILMQRIETGNDAWTFKYDYNPKLNFETKPVNVGLFSLNKLYNKNNTNIGAEVFQVGNFDGHDTWFVDAWVSKKHKDISAMLDVGLGFPGDSKFIQKYSIASFEHPKISSAAAFYNVSPEETRYYGYLAGHSNNLFGVVGNKINTSFAAAGIYGLENFGTVNFGTYDRQTGNIWIKSQTAVGNVNDKFFSVPTIRLLSNLLALPAFQPIHLSPLSTKGDYALKLEYKKNAEKDIQETEIMLATDKTPFVQVGIGVNTEIKCGKATSNLAIELFKEQKFGKFTGSAEARYNARTSTATGYVKMSYTF
jgi:hypothetical protein